MTDLPGSILFSCDYNAVRSPMAEGIMKQLFGSRVFVQSAGVRSGMEIDGFSIAVCAEIGVDLARHKARTFAEMVEWGFEEVDAFDIIVALSPASQRQALEYTRNFSVEVEYWPTLDPTDLGETREQKLDAYRQTRDQILNKIRQRFASGG